MISTGTGECRMIFAAAEPRKTWAVTAAAPDPSVKSSLDSHRTLSTASRQVLPVPTTTSTSGTAMFSRTLLSCAVISSCIR